MEDLDHHLIMKPGFEWTASGRLSVTICLLEMLDDAAWDSFTEQLITGFRLKRKKYPLNISYFPHTGPTAKQRKRMAAGMTELGKLETTTALISESVIARGASTAFGWMMPGFRLRGFALNDIHGALTWLAQHGGVDIEAGERLFNYTLAHAQSGIVRDQKSAGIG